LGPGNQWIPKNGFPGLIPVCDDECRCWYVPAVVYFLRTSSLTSTAGVHHVWQHRQKGSAEPEEAVSMAMHYRIANCVGH